MVTAVKRAGRIGALTLLCTVVATCAQTPPAAAPDQAAQLAFRNAVNPPPAGWTGPVFQLSHDYPTQDPGACPKTVCTWLDVSAHFNTEFDSIPPKWQDGPWGAYIHRILDYVKEGQDPNLANDAGFRVQVNGKTRWYHVPWMAYDPTAGREFVHGTTNERTAHIGDLVGDGHGFGLMTLLDETPDCAKQYPNGFESWSVGFYNERGGYALGQAIGTDGKPRIGSYLGTATPEGLPFPEGTVVAKVLTTSAPVNCVPYLKGAPEWQVNRHRWTAQSGYDCDREVQTSHVVQIDVAVVDSRSPSRWVYGTFAYDGNIKADNAWDRMVPVGLQWGSDPLAFPAVPRAESRAVVQSVLNRSIGTHQHWGCNGRLAGPVDNPASSCVSCHGSAFAAPNGAPSLMGVNVPPSFGFPGMCGANSTDNSNYFANIVYPQSYTGGQYPDALNLDTSLQLEVAYTEYGYYATDGKPQPCTDPNQG